MADVLLQIALCARQLPGLAGLVSDVEIAANDSIYIFIQVNVNPNNASSPMIITDAINFVVNGNSQIVLLRHL